MVLLEALSAGVLGKLLFLGRSSWRTLVLLCDTRPVPVYYSETSMDSRQTALETFDPARGPPGVAFGTRSVVKLDYRTREAGVDGRDGVAGIRSCKQRG